MRIQHFFHPATWTHTYVVFDEASGDAVLIDPALDFDAASWTVSTESFDGVAEWIERHELKVHYCLDTHVHADHMSASQQARSRFGAAVVIGAGVTQVIAAFRDVLGLGEDVPADASNFDRLANDGDVLQAGALNVTVITTPGHTPACVTYHIGDAIFTGDALFLPDQGTGRCDFPGGSAQALYDSISRKLYALPPSTRVFAGHDYGPGGRAIAHESTVEAEMQHNVQLPASRSLEEFLLFRTTRDAQLSPPRLLFPSLQVNVRAGRLPAPAEDGRRFLMMPLNVR